MRIVQMHADAKQQQLVTAMAALVVRQTRLKRQSNYWKAPSLRR
jgi:hypothetical protein